MTSPLVAIATLGFDQAFLARDVLADAGIEAEVKSLAAGPFVVAHAGDNLFEVRVPRDRLTDADGVLRQLADASASSLATLSSADESDPVRDRMREAEATAVREAEPPARHKSTALGVVYALLVPCLGPIYAGSPMLALASLFIHVVPIYTVLSGQRDLQVAMWFWVVGRVLDVVGTSMQIARHNRLLGEVEAEEEHGAHP